ncbi:MAG TPA: polyphenol oxidase family protein [Phycisphaerae bacterium]|nr:polyphenol oxidase family protein [Phycisphaerae bacterium]
MNETRTIELASRPLEDSALLSFPQFDNIDGFAHAFTTRPWNMSPHRGPDNHLAVERRRRVCEHLGLPFANLTAPDQIHSPHVLRVGPSDVGAGREGRDTAIQFVDGLVCDLPDVPIMQFSADCPLILAVDPRRRIFGTAHASWRGTVAHIAMELVEQLSANFKVRPHDLLVGIGPCAGPGEYEVGEVVRRIALARLPGATRFFHAKGDPGAPGCFDLRAANVAQLLDAGIRPDHIAVAAPSTMTDPRFFSHRRDGPDTGRFALIAGFRSEPRP